MKINLTLKQLAKNKGGDRYEGQCAGENLVVYFPQAVTRKDGAARPSITMTLEV